MRKWRNLFKTGIPASDIGRSAIWVYDARIPKYQNTKMKIQMDNLEINKSIRLSEHFTLGEVTKTSHQTADKNIPSRVASATASAAIGFTSP